MKVARFALALFRRYPHFVIGNALVLVVESAVGIVSIFTVAPVIDLFLTSDPAKAGAITKQATAILQGIGLPATLPVFLAVFLVSHLFKNSLTAFAKYCLLQTKYAVLRDLMTGTLHDFFRARWGFFSGSRQGTMLNTFFHEMTVVGDAFGAMEIFFASLLKATFYVAVPLYVSWRVASVSVVAALVFAVPFLLLGRLNYRLGRQSTLTANHLSGVLHEALSLAKVVLGFGNQDKSERAAAAAFDAHRVVTIRAQILRVATPLLYEPLGMFVLVITVAAAGRFNVPLSETAVMLWAFRNCIPLVGELTTQKNALLNFFPSYEQVMSLRAQARALAQPSGARRFEGLSREIALDNVTLAHPGHPPSLVDVTVRIPKGRMVAIVGESGAGKSTIVDLIMGLSAPGRGTITVDGVPLSDFDLTSYRARIGYVPQESVLFNESILDNLRWADETATVEQIEEACRQANAAEFIERAPARYKTIVGDRGVRLSAGQCQRIALARAIVRKPDLLIMDEATSALDSLSERLIQHAIEGVARDTTVVVIAHRLSTITNADYIYVLHRGQVVEEGTYHDLCARDGHFTRMTQLQVLEARA